MASSSRPPPSPISVRESEDQLGSRRAGVYEQIQATVLDPTTNLLLQPVSAATMTHFGAVPLEDLRDPFDRFILATALQLKAPLVTADRAIAATGAAEIVW